MQVSKNIEKRNTEYRWNNMQKNKIVCVRLQKSEVEALDLIAKRKGIDRSKLLRKIIRGYLKYKGLIV